MPVYGYSGAGKSFTLLTGPNSVFKNAIKTFIDKGAKKIEIFRTFDIYGTTDIKNDTLKIKNTIDFGSFKGYKTRNDSNAPVHFKGTSFDIYIKEGSNTNSNEEMDENIKKYIDELTKYRQRQDIYINKDTKRSAYIKGTPNNPESSRSHLLIVLKIENSEGQDGYLTLMDMAGIENPLEISSICNPSIPPLLLTKKDNHKHSFLWPKNSNYGTLLLQLLYILGQKMNNIVAPNIKFSAKEPYNLNASFFIFLLLHYKDTKITDRKWSDQLGYYNITTFPEFYHTKTIELFDKMRTFFMKEKSEQTMYATFLKFCT